MAIGAHYQINQAANSTPTGTTDIARVDIYQNQLVHLAGDSFSGQVSPVWTILAWPDGAAHTQPTNHLTFDATYTFPTPGSYLVEFLVNDGLLTNAIRFIVGVTRDANGLIYDDGVREPAFGEALGDDNAGGNVRGWAKAYEVALSRDMPAISDVATLLLRRSNRHKHVHLLGRFAPGDGGGGDLYWDAASSEAHNGGTIFQPGFGTGAALATGRWRLRHVGGLPVTAFGAVPDCQSALDGAITAGTATLTSATTTFVAGQTVLIPGAALNPLSGTAQTFTGSRAVWGTSAALYEDELWEGAKVTFSGHAGTFEVTPELTGTAHYKATDQTFGGTGTKWATEAHAGMILRLRGGTNTSGTQTPMAFARMLNTLTSDTVATTNAPAPDSSPSTITDVTGAKMRWIWRGDATILVTGTRTVVFVVGEIAVQASSGARGFVIDQTATTLTLRLASGIFDQTNAITAPSGGSFTTTSALVAAQSRLLVKPAPSFSASGLTMFGPPKTLVATVLSVSGGGHTATLSVAAGVTVTGGLFFYGTDNTPAFTACFANTDHALIPSSTTGVQALSNPRLQATPGSYLCATSPTIPHTHPGMTVEWQAGAQLIVGDSFRVNAPSSTLKGHNLGYSLGGGSGFSFHNIPNIKYVGRPAQAIVMIQDGSASTSAGTGIRGLIVQQCIDFTQSDLDTGFGGTGGVVGVAFGSKTVPGAADNGFVSSDIVALECYDGVIFYGGTQAYEVENISSCRYNNGWYPVYTFTGSLTGLMVGGGPLNGGEAVTQATTGATGIVESAGSTLVVHNTLGQFDATHVLTGDTSGATFTPTSIDLTGGPFSAGVCVGVGITSRYPASAACTDGKIGIRLSQGHACGIQLGNPYGGQVVTTDFWGGSIENTPPIDAAYVRLFGAVRCHGKWLHCENGPTADDWSHVCVELGSPVTNTHVQGVSLSQNFMAGGSHTVAAYGWDGFKIEGNLFDNQGTYAQNATHFSKFFARLFAGGVQKNGFWGKMLKPSGGAFGETIEVWPDNLGVEDSDQFNIDQAGNTRPAHERAGRNTFEQLITTNLSGGGKTYGGWRHYGNTYIGDPNNDVTSTVNADSAAGQNLLRVSVDARIKFAPNAQLEINTGGPRDEFVTVRRVIDSGILELVGNLANTHTAAQADVVKFAPSFLWGRGVYIWEGAPGGGDYNIKLDNGRVVAIPLFDATAGAPSHVTGLIFNSNIWNGTVNTVVGGSFAPQVDTTGASWKMHQDWTFNGSIFGQIRVGPGWSIGGGQIAFPNFSTPAIVMKVDDGTILGDTVRGAALTDADATLVVANGNERMLPAATLTTSRTIRLGATGATANEGFILERRDVTANTWVIKDDVSGTTLYTFPVSVARKASFVFDGTNWQPGPHVAITV